MPQEKQHRYSRQSISLLPWLSLLFAIPFTLQQGLAPISYLATGCLTGTLWLLILIRLWKTNGTIWNILNFILLIAGYRLSLYLHTDTSGLGHYFQWMFTLVSIAGLGVIFFKRNIILHCGLDT